MKGGPNHSTSSNLMTDLKRLMLAQEAFSMLAWCAHANYVLPYRLTIKQSVQ